MKKGQELIDQLDGQFQQLLSKAAEGKATPREIHRLDRLHVRILNLEIALWINSQN